MKLFYSEYYLRFRYRHHHRHYHRSLLPFYEFLVFLSEHKEVVFAKASVGTPATLSSSLHKQRREEILEEVAEGTWQKQVM